MSESRITRQRRIFVEAISVGGKIPLSTLKKDLVGKGENQMDITTLYRIIETFKQQGLIHEVKFKGKRYVFPCNAPHTTDNDAVTLTICENCGTVYDNHTPLPQNYTQSITHARTKSCHNCTR